VGGFGTVAWVDVKEYDMAKPDVIAVNGAEKTLQVLPKKTNSFNCGKYVIMSCNTSMQSFHKWKNKEFLLCICFRSLIFSGQISH
jgi:hypothetical protein